MTRESIARIVVGFYPREMREVNGGELVGTLLDAADESRRAWLLQLGSVVRAGLLTRARLELSRPPRSIAASTLSWVAVLRRDEHARANGGHKAALG